ncbi:glycosyltransferase [Flexithrix dorotheae]|uniref:glycosyltransferase n=1 Tax=Flexithrix dorotheae TaxID=70993 RepID=UPI000377835E|nr:nucleotide disphospho-sugar-binding domain-containing protein [Flexithrix dorotheae]
MKILLTSIGTRGDMEPFLAIGEMLRKKGHEVICLFPEQFRNLAEESDMRFASLGTEFIEMLESDIGKLALGGGGSQWKKIFAYIKLAKIQAKNNKTLIRLQQEVINKENPDRIVHNGKAMYPVIWEVTNKDKTIFVSPVPNLHYVKGNSHLAFNSNYGAFFNKLTFKIADWGLINTIMSSLKLLEISNIRKKQIKEVIKNHKVIYTISPQLFPRPEYWKPNLKVLGYHERNKMVKWSPDAELIEFLEKNPKTIFITFGSMTNPEPEKKTRIIMDILSDNRIPALINTASGGLVKPATYDKNLVYFVDRIPYDWVFPKMYGIVHHGGSGTTHMGLKSGCATLIIPHIIDQFLWNKLINRVGAGPLGIKIGKITRKQLEPLVLDLVNNKSYKEKAEEIGREMKREDYNEELCHEITQD